MSHMAIKREYIFRDSLALRKALTIYFSQISVCFFKLNQFTTQLLNI